jgi:hypothetical protein
LGVAQKLQVSVLERQPSMTFILLMAEGNKGGCEIDEKEVVSFHANVDRLVICGRRHASTGR